MTISTIKHTRNVKTLETQRKRRQDK